MGISVVITHYSPPQDTLGCRDVLKGTIEAIRRQRVAFDVEIILCDDGSDWSSRHIACQGMIEWSRNEIENASFLKDLPIDRYLFVNSGPEYWAVRLKHRAYELALYDKVVVLDDDHAFLGNNGLERFNRYLDKYDFVRGRIIGPDGFPQLFCEKKVQGTTFGLKKRLYFEFGGYGKYLFENAYGEDDDIFFQAFRVLTDGGKRLVPIKACYAGEIVTKDLLSGRYLGGQAGGNAERYDCLLTNFVKTHGVHPRRHIYRDKSLWMEIPSAASWISEIYFSVIWGCKTFLAGIARYCYRFKRLVSYCRSSEGRQVLKKRFYQTVLRVRY